jgi:hypothetical protein
MWRVGCHAVFGHIIILSADDALNEPRKPRNDRRVRSSAPGFHRVSPFVFSFPAKPRARAVFTSRLSCFYPRGKVSCRFGLFDTTRGVARHSRSRASP